MHLKKLVIVLLVAVCSVAYADTPNSDLLRILAREIQKMDPWVESAVESDYTTAATKPVKIQLMTAKQTKDLAKLGLTMFTAAYDPLGNNLIVPEVNGVRAVEVVCHELWHALYDSEGVKGLIYQSGYSGPTAAEVNQYVQDKFALPEFVKERQRLQELAQTHLLIGRVSAITNEYMGGLRSMGSNVSQVRVYLGDKELKPFFTPRLHEQYSREVVFPKAELKKATQLFTQTLAIQKKMQQEKKFPVGELEKLVAAFEQAQKIIAPWVERAKSLYDRVQKEARSAEERKYLSDIALLDAEINQEKNQGRRQLLTEAKGELVRAHSEEVKFRATVGDFNLGQADVFMGEVNAGISTVVGASNSKGVSDITNDPNEVMARVVDSCYSLYFGPITNSRYPLNENDLKFLESFKFSGVVLFRKGVEKYRLAIRLISDGIKPEKVREALEYATGYTYQGVSYQWPASRFVFKGVPPYIDDNND